MARNMNVTAGGPKKKAKMIFNIHTITPVLPEGLGRGVPIVHPQFAGMFMSHVTGGEPMPLPGHKS